MSDRAASYKPNIVFGHAGHCYDHVVMTRLLEAVVSLILRVSTRAMSSNSQPTPMQLHTQWLFQHGLCIRVRRLDI